MNKTISRTEEVKRLLLGVNAQDNLFKYPVGNRELTERLKMLEEKERIRFNNKTNKWEMN